MSTWIGVHRSTYFTEEEKTSVLSLTNRYGIKGPINESILAKMREDLANAAKTDDVLMDERALDKLLEIMKSSSKFSAYLSDIFGKSWDKILAFYKGSFEESKIALTKSITSGTYDFPRQDLDREVADMSKLSVFWLRDFKRGILDDIRAKYAKCLLAESLENNADMVVLQLGRFNPNMLVEGKDSWSFLDRGTAAVSGTKPFDTIRKVSELNRSFNNTSMNRFAELSTELGSGKLGKFVCLGTLAAKLSDMRQNAPGAEDLLKSEPMLRFLPDYKALVSSFEMLAVMTVVLDIIKEITSNTK